MRFDFRHFAWEGNLIKIYWFKNSIYCSNTEAKPCSNMQIF